MQLSIYANIHEITNDNDSELAAKLPEAEDLCQFVYRVTPTTQSLDVNINKLTNDLRGIKINKASGPDGISSRSLAIAGLSA